MLIGDDILFNSEKDNLEEDLEKWIDGLKIKSGKTSMLF